jgi:DNA processing protein
VPADAGRRDAAGPWPSWPPGFASDDADLDAAIVLSGLRGTTPRRLLAMASDGGTASAVLGEIRAGRAGSANDRAFANEIAAGALREAASACGARIVPWGAPEYPTQLRHIHDPPALLYVIGRPPPDPTAAVAVVGSRRCTPTGRELAHEIGRRLATAGVTVVSGAARGIDTAAHEGALAAGGRTLAVMGCGVDVPYPRGARDLIERIRASGTVLSEHAPGTPPLQWNFPARNRIVAGLCRATVVVEGAAGSGSMITAEHALEFGREVFAVPGAVTNPLAASPLRLIREGAAMVRGAEDLLADLDIGVDLAADEVADRAGLTEPERRVLEALAGATLPERVAAALGGSLPEVVGVLMRLELRGLVRSVGGRYESTLRGSAASG